MVDEFSIPLSIVELIVPEGLFSVRFESHSHVPGVSPPFNPKDRVRELTMCIRWQVAYLTSESVPLWFTLGTRSSDIIPTSESDAIQPYRF